MVDLIRAAQPEDMPAIYEMMAEFDMFGEFSEAGCLVAERDGRVCGFARLEWAEDHYYLRPIVVARREQGKGVGKNLLQHAQQQVDTLIVIARGSKAGFYTQAGFRLIDWEGVHSPFLEECNLCPDLSACQPVPMIFTSN